MKDKHPPASHVEIVYTDNTNKQVDESHALYKTTNYYDNDGNITKFIIQIRFSLDQEW